MYDEFHDMTRRFLWLNMACLSVGLFFAAATFLYWQIAEQMIASAEDAVIASLPPRRLDIESDFVRRARNETDKSQTANSESAFAKAAADKQGTVNSDHVFKNQGTTTTAIASSTAAPGSIPGRVNLAVPFTSQAPEKNWSQPWQDACEEAAVLMLDAFYKGNGVSSLFAKDEIIKMVNWEKERGWGNSISIEKVKELTEWYAFPKRTQKYARIVENPTVEDIKKFIASEQPVVAVAYGKALPNPYFRNGGPEYHALIIRGYTEDEFITNDPGTWRGENFKYKYDDLMNAIRDWNGGDVKNGRRAVLVVE